MKELWSVNSDSLTLDILNGEVSSFKKKTITKKSFRVFHQNKVYQSSGIGDLTSLQLEKMALNQSVGAQKCEYELSPLKTGNWSHKKYLLDLATHHKTTQMAIDQFSKKNKNFIVSGKIFLENFTKNITRSDGMDLKKEISSLDGYLILKHRNSLNIMDAFLMYQSFNLSDLSKSLSSLDSFWEKWDVELPISKGKKNICFLGDGSTPFSLFLSSLEPESYLSGASYFNKKLQTQIFHQDLTLIDYAQNKNVCSEVYFDDEGSLRSNDLMIVEKGFWSNLIFDQRTGKKFNFPSTGNATRSFDSAILPQPWKLGLSFGEKTHQEFFESLGECIVVMVASGGDMTPTGEYASPIQLSFLVKDGKVQGRLPQFTIHGHILEYLNQDFIGSSKDQLIPGSLPSPFLKMNVV